MRSQDTASAKQFTQKLFFADATLSNVDFDALQRLSKQDSGSTSVSPVYADGVQVNHVTGDVIRWRKDKEMAERFDAQNYIRSCEREIATLRDQARILCCEAISVYRQIMLFQILPVYLYHSFYGSSISNDYSMNTEY